MRPRNWCNWLMPNRSASITTITVAFGHIDADFNDGGTHQDIDLTGAERRHHCVLLVGGSRPCMSPSRSAG